MTTTFKEKATKQYQNHWVARWQGYMAIGTSRTEAFDRLIALMQLRELA